MMEGRAFTRNLPFYQLFISTPTHTQVNSSLTRGPPSSYLFMYLVMLRLNNVEASYSFPAYQEDQGMSIEDRVNRKADIYIYQLRPHCREHYHSIKLREIIIVSSGHFKTEFGQAMCIML